MLNHRRIRVFRLLYVSLDFGKTHASGSCSLTGKTKGLLGFWNDNADEEYLLPNGDFLSTTSSMSQVHHSFGQPCKSLSYDHFAEVLLTAVFIAHE